jgi:hypothetical protein
VKIIQILQLLVPLTPLSEDVLMMVNTKGKAALENIALNKGHKVSNTRVKDNYF